MSITLNSLSTAVAATLVLAAGNASATDVKYTLWDSNQLPAYQASAADLQKKNAGITIKFTQTGWDGYWTSLSTGMVSGTAPDVFTDHLAKFPEFAKNQQLVDLTPFVQRDKLDTAAYAPGLYEVWGRAGKQYGLPKDWDTIGLIVNLDQAKKAGVTLADLQAMTWNPKDGGSFEQVIKKLTTDASGNNALSPKFDKKNVSVYGYQNPGTGGMSGQVSWSAFAVSDGFKYQDKPWDNKLYYDDARLAETMSYLAGLPGKGVSATYENTKTLGADAMFVGRKAAIVPQGSWMITYFKDNAKFDHAWVPMPVGPTGTRASMFNGLADSIWVGSKVKEEAWKWVKYLGSADCQNIVASYGVVFPAIKGTAEKAMEVQKKKGVDSSAFLTMSKSKTFLTPMVDNSSEIDATIDNALEAVLIGKTDAASALKAANARANELAKD